MSRKIEIPTDPRRVEKLIDQLAFREWYGSHSAPNLQKEDDSTYSFLLHEKRRVRDFFKKLSNIEQRVLYCRFWENLLSDEIAEKLRISESRINSILKEAIEKLRALYILELSRVQASSLLSA